MEKFTKEEIRKNIDASEGKMKWGETKIANALVALVKIKFNEMFGDELDGNKFKG